VVIDTASLRSARRQQTIVDLHKFEMLRYRDDLLIKGATISVALNSGENPVIMGSRPTSGPLYQFNLEDIDELWSVLFRNVANPPAFLQRLSDAARAALTAKNKHLL